MEKTQKMIKDSLYVHKEIKDDYKNCSENRWLKKRVYNKKVLFNGNDIDKVKKPTSGEISISKEIYKTGESSLKLMVNTNIENVIPRPSCALMISFKETDLTKYNRISSWIYIKSEGFQNFYFHFAIGNQGKEQLHAPSLIPNKWNHVIWEINRIERDKVDKISINPFLMGCPPEALEGLEVYINDVTAEKVDVEYDLGWDLEDRIAYSHCGYFINSAKTAVAQNVKDNKFYIYDKKGNCCFENEVKEVVTDLGKYYELDFTRFNKIGKYYLKIDNRITDQFLINENPYLNSIWKSINFLWSLRCGEDIPGVHSACHLNCRTKNDKGQSVPNFGGWHDAGDVSQFEICTAEMSHALLDLSEILAIKDKQLSIRLLEEAKVGINWLLRTRFDDGSRVLGVTYSIWRKNVLNDDNQTIYRGQAEDGPFENFCAAAAEAVAARLYWDVDNTFALWCKRCAISDFTFAEKAYAEGKYTKRWGPNIVSQTSGHGALAAAELYQLTKNDEYLTIGSKYADDVLACQQSEYPNWQKPIRGFFYEDKEHKYVLAYEHRGHEQSPVHGLARLCQVAPNNINYPKWINGLKLYSEYIKSTANMITPYNLIPGHVYDTEKININHFTVHESFGTKEAALESLKAQVREGIKLDENVFVRRMPIAVTRRGFHAVLLSKTKAISIISKVLKDDELKQIAINQLEWVLGKNPFASSTMYGEGHNYHPLYVAFSKQIVGSLPVGIKTFDNFDAPYWPTINNAVYKEIWGHTSGKYLWVFADLL